MLVHRRSPIWIVSKVNERAIFGRCSAIFHIPSSTKLLGIHFIDKSPPSKLFKHIIHRVAILACGAVAFVLALKLDHTPNKPLDIKQYGTN